MKLVKPLMRPATRGADDGAGAVFGDVGDAGQVHLVQSQQDGGEGGHIHQRPNGQGAADLLIDQEGQGQIQQQAQVAHADAGEVLEHGAQAVQPGGGEAVGEHEQLIAHGADAGDDHNKAVGQDLFREFHGLFYLFVWMIDSGKLKMENDWCSETGGTNPSPGGKVARPQGRDG